MKNRLTIDFRKNADKLFNKSFFEIRKIKTRFGVIYGSSNSGKSVSVHQNELINLLIADYDILFLRKYGTDLKDSCFALLQQQAKRFNIYHLFYWRYSNAIREVENIQTGHKILLKGLDDVEKLKSIVGIKRIVVEEASQITLDDFLELNRRARGFDDIRILFMFNPISEKLWVNTHLLNEAMPYKEKTTVLKYTYKDNKYATPEDIQALEDLRLVSENQYRIYALGEWGIEDKSKKFAWAFDENKHVFDDVPYNQSEVLWLSWDFNVNPISCTAFQYYDDTLFALQCFKLEHSDTWKLCERIAAAYPSAVFMVTGDASGDSLNSAFQDQMHNYRIIQQQLGLGSQQLQVPERNPSVKTNQFLLNAVLLNMKVRIHRTLCQPLIFDLNYVEVNDKKEIIRDRATEARKADFLDHARYLCNVLFDISMFRNIAQLDQAA